MLQKHLQSAQDVLSDKCQTGRKGVLTIGRTAWQPRCARLSGAPRRERHRGAASNLSAAQLAAAGCVAAPQQAARQRHAGCSPRQNHSALQLPNTCHYCVSRPQHLVCADQVQEGPGLQSTKKYSCTDGKPRGGRQLTHLGGQGWSVLHSRETPAAQVHTCSKWG